MAQWEDRKVRISGQPRPLTPLMEDLLTKVQGEAGEMLQHFPLIIAKEKVPIVVKLFWPPIGCWDSKQPLGSQ